MIYQFLLNKNDLNGHTPEELRNQMQENARLEREFNEEFYDLMNYFFNVVKEIKNEDVNLPVPTVKSFIQTKWSSFIRESEIAYRESKLDETYQRADFVNDLVRKFNLLMASSLKPKAIPALNFTLLNQQKHPLPSSNYHVTKRKLQNKIAHRLKLSLTIFYRGSRQLKRLLLILKI